MVSVSAKKVFKKISCLCTFKLNFLVKNVEYAKIPGYFLASVESNAFLLYNFDEE